MGKLGDHFPDDLKQDYIDRHLVPGQVLYLFCDFTDPPKEKYLVLACVEPEPLLFVINSSIPAFIARRPDMRRCQVRVTTSTHPFLDHDSFINCAETIPLSDQPNMRQQLLTGVGRIKGTLDDAARRQVLNAVRAAVTVSPSYKKAIEDGLSPHD